MIFNLCGCSVALGYFPPWDGPPEKDQLADHLSFHLLFHKIVQEWCVPPQHLPTSSSSCHGGVFGTRSHPPPPWQHRCCQEGFNISSDFHGLPERSWPPSTPLCTLGQVQLSWHLWSVATLSWKASAVLGFAKNRDLRSVSAKPRWHFCFPSPLGSSPCPGQHAGWVSPNPSLKITVDSG